MATITIIDRWAYTGMFGMESSWNFEISGADAALIQSDHFGLTIDTDFGLGLHPSLPASPFSEIYSSLYGPLPSDPYEQPVGGWKVLYDSSYPRWILTFAYYYQPLWTDINNWTGFAWSTVTPPGPTPIVIDPKVIKTRSPYLHIKPSDIGGTCGVYMLGTTGATADFTYNQCLTGNIITQQVGPYDSEYSMCAIVGTVAGPTGTTVTYDSACDGSFDFDTTKYTIKAWNGDVYTLPSAISYSKTKQKVVNSQTSIYINLSNLLKEKLEGDVNNYVSPTGLTASPLGPNESKWANVLTTFDNLGATVSGIYYDDYFLVLDGYTEPGEEQGLIRPFTPGWPQRILMSDWYDRTYHYGAKAKIHFVAKDLTSIDSFVAGSTVSVPISFDTTWTDSNKYIQAIDVNTTQEMTYVFNYGLDGEVIRTHITDYDCKYKNFVIMFKNKWGVIESVCFNKKSSRQISIEDSQYLRSIVDYNGGFNISRHTNKVYNTSAYEEWILNTEWLPEYMNVPLQELMLSEEIWLYDGNTPVPINKADTSFSFKTRVNDKLIQYTMKFKLSHNTINNIL